MSGRFIALREFKEGAGLVQPGSFVPGTEKWSPGIMRSVVNGGYMYDLHRVIKVDDDRLNCIQRERFLLDAALKAVGSTLVDDPDHPGHQLLVPVGDEANAIQGHRAAVQSAAVEAPKAASPRQVKPVKVKAPKLPKAPKVKRRA